MLYIQYLIGEMVQKIDVIRDLKANGLMMAWLVIASINPKIWCPTNKLILFNE